ncbi:alcohol oxidase [Pholiota conissans]|uniref:pyranose dehydrogenase (acceptor) n=1 Tax=Pholiota conissans TaxID=109636 RepID=A0A9P5Z0H3_9AGAR|nr:alcohol oxidase [Pholiota conissans]
MRSSRLLSFVLTSCLIGSSLAAIITSPSQLPSTTFDYIIVGAGNAGLVVANRLTENANVSVLVLEAGVSDAGIIPVQAPFLGPTATPNTAVDWNYTITDQTGLNGRTFAYPRGRVLGGCSTVNYLFHQYGTDEDWNRLATLSNDEGWTWNNMKQYIQKHEKFTPPIDGHNTTGQFIPSLHGFNGEVSVSLPGFNMTIDPRVINTTQELSAEFPYNQDMSGGSQSLLGIGWLQSSAGGGVRSSSSTSYLANANSRPNLTVLIHATVTKLVQSGATTAGLKSFRSVQFQVSPDAPAVSTASQVTTVTAKKEVILSAGAIGTTQILKLSGIGSSSELTALGINSTIDSPNVGENLSDHTLLPNIFSVKGNLSFDNIIRNPTATLNQWIQNKTGVFANNVANNFGFLRIPSNATIFQNTTDPAPGPKSPHWEIIFANNWFSPGVAQPATGSFFTITLVLISPTSRGTVKLASSNPLAKPLIDPKYLTTEFDIFTMREAVKSSIRFSKAPAWSDYITGPFADGFQNAFSATDDSVIDQYVREVMTTIFHPMGTAAMGTFNSTSAVVNPDLTVKGASGLRIVDGSVFPYIPSSHPSGAIYLLAERASDIIKSSSA